VHCRVKHDRLPSYSITSSAVASGDCGTVTLISVLAVLLAVLRLMTGMNLVGIGREDRPPTSVKEARNHAPRRTVETGPEGSMAYCQPDALADSFG
jgi:hypothetical protein